MWNNGLQDTGHQTVKNSDLQRWERLEVSTVIAPALCPDRVLGHVQGGRTQVGHSGLLELRRRSWESEETKSARVYKTENRRGESFIEDSGICGVPLSIQQRLVQLCEESTQGQGYTHIRLKKTVLGAHTEAGNSVLQGKPCNAQDIEKKTQKSLASLMGNNYP